MVVMGGNFKTPSTCSPLASRPGRPTTSPSIATECWSSWLLGTPNEKPETAQRPKPRLGKEKAG
eukprot:4693649-Alexandrium_andersonii.AAC.1